MEVDSAVQKWEPGTPTRKRTRSAMEGLESPPYSPAYAVKDLDTFDAVRHAAEATGAEEGWSATTVEREKKAALAKQTKKAGRGRRRRGRGRGRQTRRTRRTRKA